MLILIGISTALHVIFYLKLALGWRKIPTISKKESLDAFSVIVPVRNEESNMKQILSRLAEQNYPKHLFEVIIADDFSSDSTAEVVRDLQKSLDIDIRLVQLTDISKQGKKHALTVAVESAKYETIITTDADCWFSDNWISTYNNCFEKNTKMVAGPVRIEGGGLFGRLQQVEFAGLMGFGAVTISHENPSMCSGANLGFRKKAFQEVGGYSNNFFTPSGDDEFLLFNIMKAFPNSTQFLKDKEAIVSTSAHIDIRSFINQRIRWTSKWKYNKNWKVRLSAVLFFIDYLLFCTAIYGIAFDLISIQSVITIVALRFLSLYIFVAPINNFLKGKNSLWPLLAFQIIYPMHVLFMGMNSIFGSYTWKGRKYR